MYGIPSKLSHYATVLADGQSWSLHTSGVTVVMTPTLAMVQRSGETWPTYFSYWPRCN